MSCITEQFTPEERELLRRVHQIVHSREPQAKLASIRNDTVFTADKHFSFIEAFDTILEVNNVGGDNIAWRCLVETARRHTLEHAGADDQDVEKQQELRTRVRQTMFISMQWSEEVLTRYGWNMEKYKRDKLAFVCQCAKMFPRFKEDFVPQANLVCWLKHCAALSVLDASLEEDFAPYDGALAVKDLRSLKSLKRDKPILMYGVEVTLNTAFTLQDEIRRWTEDQDGVVIVNGERLDLKKARAEHWNIYLLKFDENGLLGRRKDTDRAATPRKDGLMSPPTSVMVRSVRAKRRTKFMASAVSGSTSSATSGTGGSVAGSVASSMAGSVAGRVPGSVASSVARSSARSSTRSSAHGITASVAEVAGAGATSQALPRIQDDPWIQDSHSTPKTSHSHATGENSHGAREKCSLDAPVALVKSDPDEPGSPSEVSSVQRTAHVRARQARVASMFLKDDDSDDDSSEERASNERRPMDQPLAHGSPHAKDSGENCSNDENSSELSLANAPAERTSTPTGSLRRQESAKDYASAREPTRKRNSQCLDDRSGLSESGIGDEASMGGETAIERATHVAALADTPLKQAGNSDVSTRVVVAAGFEGIESWLIAQDRSRSLFVGDSPSVSNHPRSEASDATPLAQTELPLGHKAVENGESPSGKERASFHEEDAPTCPDTGLSLSTEARKSPRTFSARAIPPQPARMHAAGAEPPAATETESSNTTSSSATSDSSSELTSKPPTEDSNAARALRHSTSPSERSRSETRSTLSEASLRGSRDEQVWPSSNWRDMSSPLQFAMMGRLRRDKIAIDPDTLAEMESEAAAKYMRRLPPSVSAPYLMSVEEESGKEAWDDGYGTPLATPLGLPRWHSDEDLESTHHSSGTSQESPDPLLRHLGPRPESCACDICEDIAPLLTRVRAEASLDNASQLCRARDRWFGDAKWASALGASDVNGSGGRLGGEVVYLDNASFRDLVDEQILLEKPIIVQERQHDFDMYDVEVVREELRDSHGNENVTSVIALSDAPTLVAMEDFLMRFSRNEWSLGAYTTCNSLEAQRPAFLNHPRFRLLHKAVSRVSSQSNSLRGGGLGCGDTAHSLCVNNGLSFNRIECSGAFSGPYLDPLGGTWIRNLEGHRLCAFVPLEQLTSSFFDETVRNDEEWCPRDTQRLVLLEPGDVLILPPNVVCAQLALDAGVSLQGSFWDESDWRRCFAATAWAAANRTHVTPQIPRCATRLALHGLKSLAAQNPQRFASDGFAKDYLEIDLAGVYKTVMAERCVKEESAVDDNVCHSQAREMSGRRRPSSSQAGFGQPSKRLCIR